MLRNMKDLLNYAVSATDGPIGHVTDLYFDGAGWVIRYVVVDTGSWLSSRRVLIAPVAMGYPHGAGDQPGWMEKVFSVAITKEQLKNSPDIDTDKPVTRQHELCYLGYYGYPRYWAEFQATSDAPEDACLHSCKAVLRYRVEAVDGDIGQVQGFLVDEDTWALRYIVVETNNWWLDHPVLIAPQWIQSADWSASTVHLNLSRKQVKEAPPYDPAKPVDRPEEQDIYRHYGRAGYWVEAHR